MTSSGAHYNLRAFTASKRRGELSLARPLIRELCLKRVVRGLVPRHLRLRPRRVARFDDPFMARSFALHSTKHGVDMLDIRPASAFGLGTLVGYFLQQICTISGVNRA